jgi:hypothetical protein
MGEIARPASPSEYLTTAGAFVPAVSSTGTYVPSGASAARAPANTLVAAVILGLFVLSGALSAERKGITAGFDEVAHASYVAHIQHSGHIHVTYSYGRHLSTGWLMDAYPRYYLPLAAIVPLAGLSLLAAVEAPRRRAALLAFLIPGPAIFRAFGAPLG